MRERSERVQSPGAYVAMSFTRPLFLGLVFFLTSLPCSDGHHIGWDAVRVNSEKAATTEN